MYVRYSDIYNMDGIDFEYLCADMLRKNGFTNVEVTPAHADYGIDVIAHKGGISYGIQCKRWKWQVNFDAVKEAYAGIAYYGLDRAVVLTNSRFTENAYEFAKKAHVILWGRKKLNELFQQAYPTGIVDLYLPEGRADTWSRPSTQSNYQPSNKTNYQPSNQTNYQQTYSRQRTTYYPQNKKDSYGEGKIILWFVLIVVFVLIFSVTVHSCGNDTAKNSSSTSSQSSYSSSSSKTGSSSKNNSQKASSGSNAKTSTNDSSTNSSAKPAVQESLVDYVVYSKGAVTGVDESGKIAYYLTVQEKAGGQKITSVANSAFAGCEKLKNINLPDTITSIGASAFSGCRSLTKIKLPDSVTTIGIKAFEGCTSLTEITIPKNVKSLSANTFTDSGVKKIYIPQGCTIPAGDDPFGLGTKCKIIWYDPNA